MCRTEVILASIVAEEIVMGHAGSMGLGWGLWVILQTSLTHRTHFLQLSERVPAPWRGMSPRVRVSAVPEPVPDSKQKQYSKGPRAVETLQKMAARPG